MPNYEPITDILNVLTPYRKELVGSTAINGVGNDIDIAVKVNTTSANMVRRLVDNLRDLGCDTAGGAHYQDININTDNNFTSFRRGSYNILLCFNDRSWDRFTVGRDYCILLKELGVDMSTKDVRVALHAMATRERIAQVKKDVERVRKEPLQIKEGFRIDD